MVHGPGPDDPCASCWYEPLRGQKLTLLVFSDVKVGLGISRTNADSQWNPVYNAFHRIFCCANETIRR